jgi:hypothetical protein
MGNDGYVPVELSEMPGAKDAVLLRLLTEFKNREMLGRHLED